MNCPGERVACSVDVSITAKLSQWQVVISFLQPPTQRTRGHVKFYTPPAKITLGATEANPHYRNCRANLSSFTHAGTLPSLDLGMYEWREFVDAYKTPPQGHGISLPHKLVKKMHHKRNNMNLQKSMLGRISTSVVSQISSSLFSPSILINQK